MLTRLFQAVCTLCLIALVVIQYGAAHPTATDMQARQDAIDRAAWVQDSLWRDTMARQLPTRADSIAYVKQQAAQRGLQTYLVWRALQPPRPHDPDPQAHQGAIYAREREVLRRTDSADAMSRQGR